MVPLESCRLLNDLSAGDLQQMRRIAQVRTFAAGQQIFKEGDHGDGIYFIGSGRVEIAAVVNAGEHKVLTRIQPGDFFGEMAVVDKEPRSASALAEEDSQIYFVPLDDMLDMLSRSPRLAVNLVREFSHRLRDFNRRYVQEMLQAERLGLVGRFARSIVHDFKNPLNIIGLSADMAALETATPETRESARRRIRKQVDRLSNMINELLEFTRGTQIAAVLAPTHYPTLLATLIEELRSEVSVKNVTIEFENAPPDGMILLDPARLTHVFYNLVHNAVDAMMPDGGGISLRFISSETEVITEIEDTGKGIAPEVADRLFEAFATYGKAQGTGLGLSICKRIIQDHGGHIQARSEPGHGAVFLFSLPLR